MDNVTLFYLANSLARDSQSVLDALFNTDGVDESEIKKVISINLDAISADVTAIRSYIEG